MKRKALSFFACLILLATLVSAPASAAVREDNPPQTRGALGSYLYAYEYCYNIFTKVSYERNHKYREINVPSGYKVRYTPWQKTSYMIGYFDDAVNSYTRTHEFYR